MTNPSHPKHRCFMQDFAALDSRSVHAHLRGRNLRAQAYVLFDGFNTYSGAAITRPTIFGGSAVGCSDTVGVATRGAGHGFRGHRPEQHGRRYRALSVDAGIGAASRPGNGQSAGGTEQSIGRSAPKALASLAILSSEMLRLPLSTWATKVRCSWHSKARSSCDQSRSARRRRRFSPGSGEGRDQMEEHLRQPSTDGRCWLLLRQPCLRHNPSR